MSLTDEDIWHFRHNGYHVVADVLPGGLTDRLNAVTDRHVSAKTEPIVWELEAGHGKGVVRRLSKILARDPVYLEAASHPIVLDALETLVGPNIDLLTNKHNHIMVRPGGSDPVPWHRGEQPWDMPLITGLIYLEESTVENGCIRIVPGSHLSPFRETRRPDGGFDEVPQYRRSLPVPMSRGGGLLFNDACFHGSGLNRTAASRRSMTLAYRPHDSHDVLKEDPEKLLLRGERSYVGHPFQGTVERTTINLP